MYIYKLNQNETYINLNICNLTAFDFDSYANIYRRAHLYEYTFCNDLRFTHAPFLKFRIFQKKRQTVFYIYIYSESI